MSRAAVLLILALAVTGCQGELDVRTDGSGAVNLVNIYPHGDDVAAVEAAVEERGGRVLEVHEPGELRSVLAVEAVFDVHDRGALLEIMEDLKREHDWGVRAEGLERVGAGRP